MRLRARIVGATVGVALAATGLGATWQRRASDRRLADPAVEALVVEAANVAPEFGADVLIRAATSAKIRDLEWRRELLEQAFWRAAAAREAHRRTAARSLSPDTRPGALVQAYDLRLDRVSLQTRVALAMLPVDPDRAGELFEWIDPRFDPEGCENPLVPAADEYYNTAAQFARHSARAGAVARADALHLLVLHVGRARLPSEMPAVVRAIRAFNPTSLEAVYLDGVLRSILEHGVRDARGFSTTGLDLVSRMAELADDEREAGLTPSILMLGLRRYLVGQLSGPRCADTAIDNGLIVEAFNAALRHPGVAANGLDPLTVKDLQPSTILAPAKIDVYWQTGDARRLHEAILQLRGPDRKLVPLAVRRTHDWKAEADHFLTDVERWQEARDTGEADGLYQKGVLLAGLFDLAPQADLRERAMRGLVDLLRHSMVGSTRPALWYLIVARLLEQERGATRRELLEALERSGQPVLLLYAHADRTVPVLARPLR